MRKLYCLFVIFVCATCFSQEESDSIAVEKLLNEAVEKQIKLRYDETYKLLLEALDIAQDNNLQALEFKTGISIANLFLMKGETSHASEFFENKFPKESYPADIQSYYYHRKAFYYNQSVNAQAALTTALKGVEIAKKYDLNQDLITLYNEIAFVYEHQDKLKLAEEYYNKVLDLTQHDLRTHSNVSLNKARLYTKMKKYNTSNQMLEQIKSKIDTTDFHQIKVHLYGSFSLNYMMLGDSTNYYKNRFLNRDEALKALKEYSESQYKNLQVKYQTKEKDELISKKNQEQTQLLMLIFGITSLLAFSSIFIFYTKRKNKVLQKLLDNNSFLLSELNHRTKNNLQLIVSLAARETKKSDSKEITELKNLTSKIESIATLHQQLYMDEKLDAIYLEEYLVQIVENLSTFVSHNNIVIHKQIDNIKIEANKALNIGLLVNELIINTIKYAFPDQETKIVDFTVTKTDNYIEIIYKDNGVGLPDGVKVKLVSTLSRQLEAEFFIFNTDGFNYNAKIKV